MARVLVLDIEKPEVRTAECNELSDFYRELGVDIFDIAVRKIGGRYYDIFCDDMGLYRETPIVSAINNQDEPMLVGNLVFANHNDRGETTSLSDEDVNIIAGEMFVAVTSDGETKRVWPVVRCEY